MLTTRRARLIGAAFVLLSAFAWSLNGLYARFITVDVWTTLVGRGIATAVTLFVALLLIRGRDTGRLIRRNARMGIWVILGGVVTIVAFVGALFNTTVANVTVIYSVSPLIAAVLARFLIGDRLVARTIMAFAIALAGVVIIVGGSLGSGNFFGDCLALLMAAGFAVVIVEMRRKPEIDNVTTSFLSSLLLAVLLLPLASLRESDARNALVLFLFGFTSNVLGFFAFVTGVRRMPPAEAGLIATIEIVLAPLWVWLLFAEDPGEAAILGGGIVLAAIVFHLSGELWSGRAPTVIAAGGAAKVETRPEVL